MYLLFHKSLDDEVTLPVHFVVTFSSVNQVCPNPFTVKIRRLRTAPPVQPNARLLWEVFAQKMLTGTCTTSQCNLKIKELKKLMNTSHTRSRIHASLL